MGNVSSSRPADLTSGYVGFEIRQAGDRGVFKRDPKKYTVQVENGPQLYATDYSTKCGSLYIYIQHMSLQKILVANGYLIGSPILDFVTDSGWRTRDADIIAAGGMTVCKVRKGSTFKFSHCGREYRWQRRPAGNWCRGFPDHATMKLVEMNGEACGPTMASLHLTRTPDHGRVATLYMPAAATANPEWQDLIILVYTMSQLWSRVSGSKLKDVPTHLRAHASENYTYGKLQERAVSTMASYKKQLDAGQLGSSGVAASSLCQI
ncbi:hypothetical protein WJX84_006990 [Apatococcus fuscideae]|uniref:Uncharacterized protein n=1 Tax=Apatococcus fuscideae TaxID=2026836 RepID=A0AAW1T045_9CHLO